VDLRHRDYLGMYAAALVAILFFPAVGGLLVSIEAGLMIFDLFWKLIASGMGFLLFALMIVTGAGIVETIQQCVEDLLHWVRFKYWRRVYARSRGLR